MKKGNGVVTVFKKHDTEASPGGGAARVLAEAKGISVSFGPLEVVKQVDLTVPKGEVVAIIGPSGSGKSTFLRCFNYLQPPTKGTLEIDGDVVIDSGRKPTNADLLKLRRKVGMCFQSFNLFPHLTAVENIDLAQVSALGRSKSDARSRSMELLKRVGLEAKANTKPARCSGGQQQRIAIARALALDPEMMLFDEPTSALDPELGHEVLAVMRELASSGMTMIIVTHEMRFAEGVADRIMFMADGKAVEVGEPKQVLREPIHERTQKFLKMVFDR
ncbi:ABC transporter related (plasmid) [Rhizobium leguminosarum bv. trifolii WSM2304]|uniref:ABC transporter related n=1 Tax=Rhizobium leguminosarum bv. trifolii (strain WSM2304) TaxID=395492 RepID=A0ABF7QZN5_RHILW|nr:amino acid ABC transporter ATP-binding protein [Rhizobium leguminosarum]ACI59709.1 ABC transporter related [Rhizobium leguminosarum bv. trifolii WSM2304]